MSILDAIRYLIDPHGAARVDRARAGMVRVPAAGGTRVDRDPRMDAVRAARAARCRCTPVCPPDRAGSDECRQESADMDRLAA